MAYQKVSLTLQTGYAKRDKRKLAMKETTYKYISHFCSKLGEMTLASDGEALTGLWFDGQKHFPRGLEEAGKDDFQPVFDDTRRWLDIYFTGREPDFKPQLRPVGTAFQQWVWQTLLRIPYGETTTYGAIAKLLASETDSSSMSAQAVGNAVGRNPILIIIPCHRVIGADGNLTGYAGGIKRKQALLQLEKADMLFGRL